MGAEASPQLRGALILLTGQFFGELGTKEAKGKVQCVSWIPQRPLEN